MPKHFLPSLLLIALPALGDSILAWVDVPNSLVPQGEVRLVERGAEVVAADSFGKKSGELIRILRRPNPMDAPHE